MKVIFIDIDGPLSWATWDQGRVTVAEGSWNSLKIPYPWVDEDCKALVEILDRTGAELVVSSDWKLHYGLGQLKLIFEHYGIARWKVLDTTPNFNPKRKLSTPPDWDRACQIQSWVKAFKPAHWIAIDDMQLDYSFKKLRIPKWRHVQVHGDFGDGERLRDKVEECVTKLLK